MSTKRSRGKQGGSGLAEFRRSFRVSSWKWVDEFTSRSGYLVSLVLIVYAVYAYMSFFPGEGNDRILLLLDYPSIHTLFIGFILVVILGIRWRHRIPSFFQWLGESGRLESPRGDLQNEFERFLRDYQNALLLKTEPLSISFGLILLFALISWLAGIPRFLADNFTPVATFVLFITLFICFFGIFMVGQFSWLLYVTGRFVGKLTHRFSIDIQPRHPDGCGGLKPLGDFCLDAAIPLIGGGLALSTIPVLNRDIDQVLSLMAVTVLFVLVGPLTAWTVFAPLWNIHLEMIRQKTDYQTSFATQAAKLEQIIRVHTGEKGDVKKAKIAREKLEALQSVSPEKSTYPVWPFGFAGTLLAVFSPQLIPTAIELAVKIYENFLS